MFRKRRSVRIKSKLREELKKILDRLDEVPYLSSLCLKEKRMRNF